MHHSNGEELSKRQQRALRILDAAAELIQRWGYKKTSIDDIAREAGVAKGTIYLHWKTREDLFTTLLLRESLETLLDLRERIDRDPEGLFLSNIVKHTMYIIMQRPLAKALFIGDVEVLGELVHDSQGDLSIISQQKIVLGQGMLELLRSHGMVRTDQSIATQLKMHAAIVIGFMAVNSYLPGDFQLSPEETSELLAETIRRTLEPGEPISPHAVQAVRTIWDQSFQQIYTLVNERLQKALE